MIRSSIYSPVFYFCSYFICNLCFLQIICYYLIWTVKISPCFSIRRKWPFLIPVSDIRKIVTWVKSVNTWVCSLFLIWCQAGSFQKYYIVFTLFTCCWHKFTDFCTLFTVNTGVCSFNCSMICTICSNLTICNPILYSNRFYSINIFIINFNIIFNCSNLNRCITFFDSSESNQGLIFCFRSYCSLTSHTCKLTIAWSISPCNFSQLPPITLSLRYLNSYISYFR